MKVRTDYVVYYGTALSHQVFRSWAEAARFIKHCLDNGWTVTGVRKEQK